MAMGRNTCVRNGSPGTASGRRIILAAVAVVASLLPMLMVALSTSIGVAAADDPATVVRRFIEVRNRFDVEGTLALVSDDFRLVAGPNCTPATPCVGVAAQRAELANYIRDHAQVTIVGTPQVSGTTVRIRTEGRADPFRAAGVERLINNGTVEVRDGKVASYIDVPDMSDAQTARFFAGAAQGPPSAPPRTGGGGEDSFIRRLGDG
jgi:hypothetical protein